ncbi:MAG: hypothetical protein U0V73_01410 [Acidimicrobiia bacterium]
MTGGIEPVDQEPGAEAASATAEVVGEPGTDLVPYRAPAPVTRSVQRVTRLAFGAGGTMTAAARGVASRLRHRDGTAAAAHRFPSNAVSLVPGALVGVGLVAERRLFDTAAAVESRVTRVTQVLRSGRRVPTAPRGPSRVEQYLEHWRARGEAEQARNRVLVSELVRRLAPELADAIVARIDLNKILAAIPLERLLEGVDLGALMQRIDIGSIIASMDIGTLLAEVLDAMDLPDVVRQSTSTVGGDAIDAVRSQAIGADALVERVTDRLLLRKRNRASAEPASAPATGGPSEPTAALATEAAGTAPGEGQGDA